MTWLERKEQLENKWLFRLIKVIYLCLLFLVIVSFIWAQYVMRPDITVVNTNKSYLQCYSDQEEGIVYYFYKNDLDDYSIDKESEDLLYNFEKDRWQKICAKRAGDTYSWTKNYRLSLNYKANPEFKSWLRNNLLAVVIFIITQKLLVWGFYYVILGKKDEENI